MARTAYGPNQATNFMNSSHRRIFRSAGGRFFVRNSDGKKQYAPKAAYHSMPGNNRTSVVHANHVIPRAIRPKGLRKSQGGTRPRPTGMGRIGGGIMRALFAEPRTPAKRGRKSVYATNNNRKQAKRNAAKRYYQRKKAGLPYLPPGNVFNTY